MKELKEAYIAPDQTHPGLATTLAHGDLWAGNIISTENETFFLDFQFITPGTPHCDIWFLIYSSVQYPSA